MSDSLEEEYEEEEVLIFVEIDGLLDREVIDGSPCNPPFKITGIDTESPYMQIGNECFVGEYRDMVGTATLFEENKSASKQDETFSTVVEKPVRYVGKTTKHLFMNRVFLTSKNKDKYKPVPIPGYLAENIPQNYVFSTDLKAEMSKTIDEHNKS